jgi:hypothetical protein
MKRAQVQIQIQLAMPCNRQVDDRVVATSPVAAELRANCSTLSRNCNVMQIQPAVTTAKFIRGIDQRALKSIDWGVQT